MKKFIISVLVVMVSAYAMGLFLPWWSIAIAGLISGVFIDQKAGYAFLSAFIGAFLLWGFMSFLISIKNDHILAHKISLIILKKDAPVLIILTTALIGGLSSAFSALTGRYLVVSFK